MKLSINQIQQEIQLRLNHLKRLLRSCETWDQLSTVDNYCDELRDQITRIMFDNEPFFGKDKHFSEMGKLRKYFDDQYREEYDLASDKLFNQITK